MTNQEEPVKKSGEWDMIAIQEECKKYTIVGICYINTPVRFTQGRPFSTDFSFCHIFLSLFSFII